MSDLILEPTSYAYGGTTVARDANGRPIFVLGAIPGETVRARLTEDKERYAHAVLEEVLEAAAARVAPRCPHYGQCSGCQYQHIAYEEQLRAKQQVVQDQLGRIGGLKEANVLPTLPSPQPWAYTHEAVFSPAGDGRLGYWSAGRQQVIPIEVCPIVKPEIMAVFDDIDLDLPGLRKMTLRVDSEESMLAALEVDDVEPPELEVDFPISVAIVLPDRTAASLIGEPNLVYQLKGRPFRVSPGCFFQPNLDVAEMLVDTVLEYAALDGRKTVLELYSGIGMLTAFLAERARSVTAVEVNDDAVADLIINLDHLDNVVLYHGLVEEVLPALEQAPDVLVIDPGPYGLATPIRDQIASVAPRRLIHVASELSTMARDSKAFARAGLRLERVQPLDMRPQTYHVDTVSLWVRP